MARVLYGLKTGIGLATLNKFLKFNANTGLKQIIWGIANMCVFWRNVIIYSKSGYSN